MRHGSFSRRLDKISPSQEHPLTGEEYARVQDFWLRLNFKANEWAEWEALNKRHHTLYERYCQGVRTPEDLEERNKIGTRMCVIGHDIVLQRSIRNRPLRVRVWAELGPRFLRFRELTRKPPGERSLEEKEELEGIVEYFNEVHRRALGET